MPEIPFELSEPPAVPKSKGNFSIVRDFSWKLSPELMEKLKLTPEDLDEEGLFSGDHEIVLDVDYDFSPSTFGGSMYQPPDPDEFEVLGWTPLEIDGVPLSHKDGKRLYDYLDGELYRQEENELEGLAAKWYEDSSFDEPDDDYYDYD